MEFLFDQEKNLKLFEQRGITFEQAIEIIADGGILLDFKHPNVEEYPNQRIMVINIENYPYCIPYIMDSEKIVLKTIFPDRRFKYLLEDNDEN
jgi:uncharacterized DUF497 family protein